MFFTKVGVVSNAFSDKSMFSDVRHRSLMFVTIEKYEWCQTFLLLLWFWGVVCSPTTFFRKYTIICFEDIDPSCFRSISSYCCWEYINKYMYKCLGTKYRYYNQNKLKNTTVERPLFEQFVFLNERCVTFKFWCCICGCVLCYTYLFGMFCVRFRVTLLCVWTYSTLGVWRVFEQIK